jgi:hypothetical protein
MRPADAFVLPEPRNRRRKLIAVVVMRTIATAAGVAIVVTLIVAPLPACGDDENTGTAENAGSACTTPAQCYPGVDGGTLKGEIQCLTRVPGGYCTHLCTTDADCCAVPGECRAGFRQVCSPFESTGQMMCFLACESNDVGTIDSNEYCHQNANSVFNCRSSGS